MPDAASLRAGIQTKNVFDGLVLVEGNVLDPARTSRHVRNDKPVTPE